MRTVYKLWLPVFAVVMATMLGVVAAYAQNDDDTEEPTD